MAEAKKDTKATDASGTETGDFEPGQFDPPGTPEHLGAERPYEGLQPEVEPQK